MDSRRGPLLAQSLWLLVRAYPRDRVGVSGGAPPPVLPPAPSAPPADRGGVCGDTAPQQSRRLTQLCDLPIPTSHRFPTTYTLRQDDLGPYMANMSVFFLGIGPIRALCPDEALRADLRPLKFPPSKVSRGPKIIQFGEARGRWSAVIARPTPPPSLPR